MLSHIVVAATALLVSGLTLFSGFGLGTMLMPVFAVCFPLTVAISATAVVHLGNNLLKLALIGRQADWGVVLRFALPAALAAAAGASLLGLLADMAPLARYELFGQTRELHPVKLAIGLLIVSFAMLELSPSFAALAFPPRYLVLGGLVSGSSEASQATRAPPLCLPAWTDEDKSGQVKGSSGSGLLVAV